MFFWALAKIHYLTLNNSLTLLCFALLICKSNTLTPNLEGYSENLLSLQSNLRLSD